MPLAHELLGVASLLSELNNELTTQATMRRAVSSAYCALFHLLVSEMTVNYAQAELRSELGRVFDHRKMKEACDQMRSSAQSLKRSDPTMDHLHTVAVAFIRLQYKRELADYDAGQPWDPTEVAAQVNIARAAFESWNAVRDEATAQAFLVSMLRPRGKKQAVATP